MKRKYTFEVTRTSIQTISVELDLEDDEFKGMDDEELMEEAREMACDDFDDFCGWGETEASLDTVEDVAMPGEPGYFSRDPNQLSILDEVAE